MNVTASVSDRLEHEVAAALASLAGGSDRPYYDAQADGDARTRYYAAIDAGLDPGALHGALSALPRDDPFEPSAV